MSKETSNVRSMTGYASVEKSVAKRRYRLHLKSINHRFFELKWRAPRSWAPLEIEFRQVAKKKLGRGALDFWVEELKEKDDHTGSSVQEYFDQLNRSLDSIKGLSPLKIPPFLRVNILSRNPDLWRRDNSEELSTEVFREDLESLLGKLAQSRKQEGQRIFEELMTLGKGIEDRYSALIPVIEELVESFQKEHKEKLEELFDHFKVEESEGSRVAAEVALLTEKRDCSEELQRIKMHLSAYFSCLQSEDPATGKRLDFIAQELNREWTTLGSKLRKHEVFSVVLDAKLDVEKIREQCLNVC